MADAHGEVATLVLAEGDSHAALRNTSQALVLRPDWPELLFNRGNVLRVLKRTDDAIASYDQTVALNPDFARAYWNKSHILLNRGDFAAGWPLYEWRWHLPDKAAARAFGPPRWDGTQDLSGKTLLISCEQGLGDAIQCALSAISRGAPNRNRRGATPADAPVRDSSSEYSTRRTGR